MTATEALERRIDELCAEVERLRQQVDTAKHNSVRNAREYARLCHENDRLRELVRDLWARRDPLLDFGFYAEVAEQLDKLGIEVDG